MPKTPVCRASRMATGFSAVIYAFWDKGVVPARSAERQLLPDPAARGRCPVLLWRKSGRVRSDRFQEGDGDRGRSQKGWRFENADAYLPPLQPDHVQQRIRGFRAIAFLMPQPEEGARSECDRCDVQQTCLDGRVDH